MHVQCIIDPYGHTYMVEILWWRQSFPHLFHGLAPICAHVLCCRLDTWRALKIRTSRSLLSQEDLVMAMGVIYNGVRLTQDVHDYLTWIRQDRLGHIQYWLKVKDTFYSHAHHYHTYTHQTLLDMTSPSQLLTVSTDTPLSTTSSSLQPYFYDTQQIQFKPLIL